MHFLESDAKLKRYNQKLRGKCARQRLGFSCRDLRGNRQGRLGAYQEGATAW